MIFNAENFIGIGILLSKDAFIPMQCTQTLSGLLLALHHLIMFIVVEGIFLWVQLYNFINMNFCSPFFVLLVILN